MPSEWIQRQDKDVDYCLFVNSVAYLAADKASVSLSVRGRFTCKKKMKKKKKLIDDFILINAQVTLNEIELF